MTVKAVRLGRGERLLWQGRQWAVTTRGIDTTRPYRNGAYPYWIEKERLAETRPFSNGLLADWPLHLAEKNWVDIEDFIQAWQFACRVHKTNLGNIDVAKSIAAAWEIWQEGQIRWTTRAGEAAHRHEIQMVGPS
jgi:hypothetical protein